MLNSSPLPESTDTTPFRDLGMPESGKTETMEVTPELAEMWSDAADFSLQRNMSRRHMKRIVEQIETGQWDPSIGQIAFVFSAEDSTVYNIDGQHTLEAIKKYGNPVTMDVRTYRRENTEGVSILFSRFNNGKRRSAADNISSFRLQDEFDLSKTKLGKIASAVKFIEAGFKPPAPGRGGTYKMDKYGLMLAVRDWAAAGEVFFPLVDGCSMSDSLRLRSVLSVALATCRHAPTKAKRFWYQVAWVDQISRIDPRKTLHDYVLSHNVRGRDVSNLVSEQKMARACSRAWIHFWEDGDDASLKQLKVMDEEASIHLPGTPCTR